MHANRIHDCESVHGYVRGICFKNGPPRRVGAELEWLVAARHHPSRHVPLARLRAALAAVEPLPGGSRLTYEPGGQVELSSAPAPGLAACWRRLDQDVRVLTNALADRDLELLPSATDPLRPPLRRLRSRRYDAMAAYFAALGQADLGRSMMAGTASVQVNLDVGRDPADVARRWHLLHDLGPTMVATFANSPARHGPTAGWRSARQRLWRHLDPSRTAAPPCAPGGDPAVAWAGFALDAPVMMVRTPAPARWVAAPGFTFREWVVEQIGGGPTEEDLAYHLTTLFPPVRPRGWFEVRYLDAQAPAWWPVPVAVLTALLEDPEAGEVAAEAVRRVAPTNGTPLREDRWLRAARDALSDPAEARAANALLAAAGESLRGRGADGALVALVEAFTERYPARGRCPADDLLHPERDAGLPTAGLALTKDAV